MARNKAWQVLPATLPAAPSTRNLNPRFLSSTASYDVASNTAWQVLPATLPTTPSTRDLNPRFLSSTAAYDVASTGNIWRGPGPTSVWSSCSKAFNAARISGQQGH